MWMALADGTLANITTDASKVLVHWGLPSFAPGNSQTTMARRPTLLKDKRSHGKRRRPSHPSWGPRQEHETQGRSSSLSWTMSELCQHPQRSVKHNNYYYFKPLSSEVAYYTVKFNLLILTSKTPDVFCLVISYQRYLPIVYSCKLCLSDLVLASGV